MTGTYSRGLLTDWLLEKVEEGVLASGKALLIGDGVAPADGGWTKGQPGKGEFKPYVVISAGTATPGTPADTLGSQERSWTQDYYLRSAGGSRQQADWGNDHVRAIINDLQRSTVYIPEVAKVMRVRFTRLGALRRNDAVAPPYWEGTDEFSLQIDLAP